MNDSWLEDYLQAKQAAHRDYKIEWEAVRYLLKDKMFCMIGTHKNGRPIVTLKCEPQWGELLRGTYPDIIPGYYMNKTHWNSVFLDAQVPHDIIKQMIDQSYQLILASFSKKAQEELLG